MHRQREVMPDHWNLVGLRSLLDQRRGATAHRALKILEYNNRDLRSLRWLENRVNRILRVGAETCRGEQNSNHQSETIPIFVSHGFYSSGFRRLLPERSLLY